MLCLGSPQTFACELWVTLLTEQTLPHLAGIVLGELPLALPLNCSSHDLNALHVSEREGHSVTFILLLLFELFKRKNCSVQI